MNKAAALVNLRNQLEMVRGEHATAHDLHDPYWRGVRIGLETAIAVLEDDGGSAGGVPAIEFA